MKLAAWKEVVMAVVLAMSMVILPKPRHDILVTSGNLSRLDFQRGTRI
jgi:hypothetical protein